MRRQTQAASRALWILWLLAPAAFAASGWEGLTLSEALLRLRGAGLEILFTSSLVRPGMRVEDEPTATEPREVLVQLLAPHGLRVEEAPDGRLLVVKDTVSPRLPARGTEVRRERRGPVRDLRHPVASDEVEVVASYSLLRDDVPGTSLSRREITALPHLGDDLYRAVMVLPGISGGDISGRFSVRGGSYEEVLVRLNGVELIEPFHVQDLQGLFSIVDPEIIGRVDLMTGSYPAEYGDRLSGVLEMRTHPIGERRQGLGASFLTLWYDRSQSFAAGRGRWLASLRRGDLGIYNDFAYGDGDRAPESTYWDLFSQLDYDLNASSSLSFHVLLADDDLSFEELQDSGEHTRLGSRHESSYLWWNHHALPGRRTLVETVVSAGRIAGRRAGENREILEDFTLRDRRGLELQGLRQDWTLQPDEHQSFKWGVEARRYDARYDYFNHLRIRYPIAGDRFRPKLSTTDFAGRFTSESYGFFAADRFWLGKRFSAEVGLRYDHQTLTSDSQLSPRLNVVLNLGGGGLLRFGWGHFYQSQRPHELQVEHGETEFLGAELAEHWTLGFEGKLGRRKHFRADLYRRRVSDPLPRYELLAGPWFPLPEVRSDLVLVAAEQSIAEGLELHLKTVGGRRFGWWASYTYSSVGDVIDGIGVHRYNDQTHALTLDANWQGNRWNLNALLVYHSGWPATAIFAEAVATDGGEVTLRHTIGPVHAERYPGYHRLDLRVSRSAEVRRGELTFFFDVQNSYNRQNSRGVGIDDEELTFQGDGSVGVEFPQEHWLSVIPSFGVSWKM